MPDDSLLSLLDIVRGKTLRILADVTDEQAKFSAGLANHILWHAGHILVVNERLGVSVAAGAEPVLPPGWADTFGPKSKPATISKWPSLDDVLIKLRDQQTRFNTALLSVPDDRLGVIVNDVRNWTLRQSVVYGLNDEAAHTGEIYLLKKLSGKTRV